jgi:hypothetical protein
MLLTAEPYSVALEAREGRFHGQFDVRLVQLTAEAESKDDFTDEVKLNLDAGDARRTVEEGFHYKREIEIHPGTRTLKVAFCDRATGRLGSLRISLPAMTAQDH